MFVSSPPIYDLHRQENNIKLQYNTLFTISLFRSIASPPYFVIGSPDHTPLQDGHSCLLVV